MMTEANRLAALLHEAIRESRPALRGGFWPSDEWEAEVAARLIASGVRVETPHDTSTIARFWSKVDVPDHVQCWEWKGARLPDGYGQFWLDGRIVRAHRFSYEAHYGPIPDGLHVMHACDNPSCVRPDHLRTGTVADNNADM